VFSGEGGRGANLADRELAERGDTVLGFAEELELLDPFGDRVVGLADLELGGEDVNNCLLDAGFAFAGFRQSLSPDLTGSGGGEDSFAWFSGLLEFVHNRHGKRISWISTSVDFRNSKTTCDHQLRTIATRDENRYHLAQQDQYQHRH
jgi:hypothetical protein